jgi:outer membrane protein assembly factor BamD (BamD/ComL family)
MISCGGEDATEYNETQEDGSIEIDYDELSQELVDLEKEILESEMPDEELLKEATTKFQDFANEFPDDPKSPDYLLKASDFSLALDLPSKSVKILNQIIDKYPDYNRMEDVMYVKASHLDFNLRDTTRAKEAYREFIEKYPNSELIDDCEIRIKFISYSLEEYADKLIKDLESQPQ